MTTKTTIHRQVIPAFEKFGVTFGPYTQTILLEEGKTPGFFLDAPPEASRSQYGNIHPHAPSSGGQWGVSWWPFEGRGAEVVDRMEGNIDALLGTTRFICSESIRENDPDAYCRAEDWVKRDVWWCEACDTEHPEGETCTAAHGQVIV